MFFPPGNFCTSHSDEIPSIACNNVLFFFYFVLKQGQLTFVVWRAPFFVSQPQVVICGTAVWKPEDIMAVCECAVCCPLLFAWMDGNHTGRMANQRQQPWKWRIRPVCQGGQRKCYCTVIAPAGSYTNTLKRHLACCLPTLIFSKRSWLRRCQRERVSHYYDKTIATSQAEKREILFSLGSYWVTSSRVKARAGARTHVHVGTEAVVVQFYSKDWYLTPVHLMKL